MDITEINITCKIIVVLYKIMFKRAFVLSVLKSVYNAIHCGSNPLDFNIPYSELLTNLTRWPSRRLIHMPL